METEQSLEEIERDLVEKLTVLYKELIPYMSNKLYTEEYIKIAIDKLSTLTKDELNSEYINIKAFKNYILKSRMMNGEHTSIFFIAKYFNIGRTFITLDTPTNEVEYLEVKIPSNINNIDIERDLFEDIFIHNKLRLGLYLKKISQLDTDYDLLRLLIETGKMKLYIDNKLVTLYELDCFNKVS